MKASRTVVLLVGGMIALGLGACGGGSTDDGSNESSSASTAQEASKEATQEQAPENASQGGLTAPGTKLAFGQQANLVWVPPAEELEGGGKGFKVRVTVDSIEEGTIDDFDGVDLETDEKNSTPYYMNVTVEALEEIPASVEDEADLELTAIDDRGQEQASITFFGEFSRCDDEAMPKPMKAGESFESCFAYLIAGGGSIVEAQWNSGPASGEELTPYFEEPVVWGPVGS